MPYSRVRRYTNEYRLPEDKRRFYDHLTDFFLFGLVSYTRYKKDLAYLLGSIAGAVILFVAVLNVCFTK